MKFIKTLMLLTAVTLTTVVSAEGIYTPISVTEILEKDKSLKEFIKDVITKEIYQDTYDRNGEVWTTKDGSWVRFRRYDGDNFGIHRGFPGTVKPNTERKCVYGLESIKKEFGLPLDRLYPSKVVKYISEKEEIELSAKSTTGKYVRYTYTLYSGIASLLKARLDPYYNGSDRVLYGYGMTELTSTPPRTYRGKNAGYGDKEFLHKITIDGEYYVTFTPEMLLLPTEYDDIDNTNLVVDYRKVSVKTRNELVGTEKYNSKKVIRGVFMDHPWLGKYRWVYRLTKDGDIEYLWLESPLVEFEKHNKIKINPKQKFM